MKNITLVFLLLLSFEGFSQNLKLNELLALRSKDPVELEEFLSKKNWEFIGAKSPAYDYDELGNIRFAFEMDRYTEKAKSFIWYYYSDVTSTKRIYIQFHDKIKYLEYLEAVKKFNPSLYDSTISGNSITKVYRGKTTSFEFGIMKSTESLSSVAEIYSLIIQSNDDYDSNY